MNPVFTSLLILTVLWIFSSWNISNAQNRATAFSSSLTSGREQEGFIYSQHEELIYSSRTFALSATVQPYRLNRIAKIIQNTYHLRQYPLSEHGLLVLDIVNETPEYP